MKLRLRTATLGLGVASLLLAACGSTASTSADAQAAGQLSPNYSTVLESATGNLFTEVKAYQHGQVLEAHQGSLRLMTPEGVSTRGGVSVALAPDGQTAWAAVMAQLSLFVSPLYVGPVDSWRAAELSTAVAPFPGSILPGNVPVGSTADSGGQTAVAIVGSKAYGAANQELVTITAAGSVAQILDTNPTLEHLGATAHCSNPVYESLTGSTTAPTLLARCSSTTRVLLLTPGSSGTAVIDRAPSGTVFRGLSQVKELPGNRGAVAAAIVSSSSGAHPELVMLGPEATGRPVHLDGNAVATPSFATSSTGEWALVPLSGGRSQVVEFSATGSVLSNRVGPSNAQGIGVSLGDHPLVVAARPSGTLVTLWRGGSAGFVRTGSLTIPQGVNG